MATIDMTASPGVPILGLDKAYKLSKTIDFAKTNVAQSDVLQLFDIPAKTIIKAVVVDVLTAEGGTATGDIGDGDGSAGFLSNVNLNSVASTCSGLALTEGTPNTITGYSNGKYYSAADTLDLTCDHALDAAKIKVTVFCFDMS